MIYENDILHFDILEVMEERRVKFKLHTENKDVSVISYRFDGGGCIVENNRELRYCKDDMIFIPEGSTYFQHTDYERIIYIHLRIHDFHSEGIEIIKSSDKRFGAIFEEINFEWMHKRVGYKFKCQSLLHELFYLMQRSLIKDIEGSYKKIEKSIQYLYVNISDPALSITDLALQSGISDVYFRKIFFEHFNTTPLKFINQLRINNAKSLLLREECSVAEVAAEVGFTNYAYFYECFKKHEGKSPTEYIAASHAARLLDDGKY